MDQSECNSMAVYTLTLSVELLYYLPPAGDINLHHVCACVRVCVRGCVCHAVFSKTITVRHFLSKKSPNEFSCPRIFFWFYSF